MADFLLELTAEEIPARMQAGARTELEKLFRRELDVAGIACGNMTVFSTPRRLALIARGLPLETDAVREEAKGPPVGAPDQAVDGFCRKNGVNRDQLEEREVKGRATWFAVKDVPGQAVADLLAAAIIAIIRDFSWPKSMRWGEASFSPESLKWVRPLTGIVALLDGEVVPVVLDGIASGRETVGHRFHHSGAVSIADADTYASALRDAHVIVDHEERAGIIREAARKAARAAGLSVLEDEGLVVENAGLTEWPVPLLGRFDEAFLDVPSEVIQLTARVNQKYFVCEESGLDGTRLANAFICTANIAPSDPAVVVDGNRKVLAARLADARFFWELDQKKTLAQHGKGLERITFHEKLGTVADKVDRVAKLARWLVEEGIVKPTSARHEPVDGPSFTSIHGAKEKNSASTNSARAVEDLADLAEQAARLCKADLVTEMVGEFPKLQGLMGGYYAEKEGLPREVSDAIRDHYKPVGQGDEVPTAPVTVAVSLADKLDTLIGFFAIDEKPTGSTDPFALRRAALSVIRSIQRNYLRLDLHSAVLQLILDIGWRPISTLIKEDAQFREFMDGLWPEFPTNPGSGVLEARGKALLNSNPKMQPLLSRLFGGTVHKSGMVFDGSLKKVDDLLDFFADRLKVQQREAGVRHDLIDAVFALGGEDDLVRLLARVKALQSFIETENGTNLLAGYKRAANILKKERYDASIETITPAQAGVQGATSEMDSGLRRNDEGADRSDDLPLTGEEDPLALAGKPEFDDTFRANQTDPAGLSYTPEPSETALTDALSAAEPKAAAAIEAEDFEAAMAALASLRATVDRFFDNVTVNDPQADKRSARLALLARFRDAVHRVADFSRIEG